MNIKPKHIHKYLKKKSYQTNFQKQVMKFKNYITRKIIANWVDPLDFQVNPFEFRLFADQSYQVVGLFGYRSFELKVLLGYKYLALILLDCPSIPINL